MFGVGGAAGPGMAEWSALTEVPLRAPRDVYVQHGVAPGYWTPNERRIDVLLVRNWASRPGHERIAVEVKVTKADYLRETAAKRAPAQASAHRWAYAAPAGVIPPASLPTGWGLIEVTGTTATWTVRGPRSAPPVDLDYLVAVCARRAARAADQIAAAASDPAALAAATEQIRLLEAALARRDHALTRLEAVAADAANQLAGMTDQTCADCGQPVRYTPGTRRRGPAAWRHTDPDAERVCAAAREAADIRRREAEYGSAYTRGFAGPVLPTTLAGDSG
jgi:hypothetical protein